MDPAILVPRPETLPVHWGWLQLLLILTFTAHILLMNVMVGGGVIALCTALGGRSGEAARLFTRDVSDKLTFTIALTINLGVAPLLFLQVLYGQFIYVSSILMAVFWLGLVPVLIIAYYAAYYNKGRLANGGGGLGPLALCVVLLLFTGFILSGNVTLMLSPEAWKGYFQNAQGTLLNLGDPTRIPRYLHFMVASVAVGGLFTALVWSRKRAVPEDVRAENVRRGMVWFAKATLLQFLVGGWFLISLPSRVRDLFMGGEILHTTLLALGMGLTLLVLHLAFRGKVRATIAALLPLVLVMALMRDLVRSALLSPWFSVSAYASKGEYGPMVIFLLSLVLGIGAVVYMLLLAREAVRSGDAGAEARGHDGPDSEGKAGATSPETAHGAGGERG